MYPRTDQKCDAPKQCCSDSGSITSRLGEIYFSWGFRVAVSSSCYLFTWLFSASKIQPPGYPNDQCSIATAPEDLAIFQISEVTFLRNDSQVPSNVTEIQVGGNSSRCAPEHTHRQSSIKFDTLAKYSLPTSSALLLVVCEG